MRKMSNEKRPGERGPRDNIDDCILNMNGEGNKPIGRTHRYTGSEDYSRYSPQGFKIHGAPKLYEKTFDEIVMIKRDDEKTTQISCRSYPMIILLSSSIIKKKCKIPLQQSHVNGVSRGMALLQINEKISQIKSMYDNVMESSDSDEGMVRYIKVQKKEYYMFSTRLNGSSPIKITANNKDIAVLSEISEALGIHAYSLYLIAYLMGIQDTTLLKEYHKDIINKEIEAFWKHVDRRYRRMADNDY